MLSVHGLVRIVEAEPVQQKGDSFWILNMRIVARRKKKVGEEYRDQYSHYKAKMMFNRREDVDDWVPQMVPGRVIDIRWAELQGQDAHGGGWLEIILRPDIRHTIPKYKETLNA